VSKEVPVAKDILARDEDLFLNSPIGYAFAERIEKKDLARLKSFMIAVMVGPDDKPGGWGDAIRASSHEEVINTFLDNHFTFDPVWYGVRELPKGVDGRPISRLDDPEYRRKIGLSS
jgi:hypothetical protein